MIYSHIPFYLLNVLLHGVVYAFLVIAPFRSRLRHSLAKTLWLVLAWLAFIFLADMLFLEIETPFPVAAPVVIIVVLLCSVVSGGIMQLAIKHSFFQLMFVLFVLIGFQTNLMMFARLLYAKFPFPTAVAGFPYFNYLLLTVFVLICALPFLWYLNIELFGKVVATNIDFLQWKYLFVMPLSYFLYCQVSRFGGIDTTNPGLSDFLLLTLLNICVYSAYVSVLKMLMKSYDNHKVSERAAVMERQLEMQRGQYEKLTDSIKRTSRQRHDWRHHLLIIKGYTENHDLDGLEQYLGNYFSENPIENDAPVCANHSVDILLRHYMVLARANNTSVDLSVNIPDSFAFSDHRLCIVFGNLVENAVESCMVQKSGSRFIRVKAQPIGDQLAIVVENSYDSEILMDNEDFRSTKHGGNGVGISSVRSIAEMSGGNFRVCHEGGVFKVSVLLSC